MLKYDTTSLHEFLSQTPERGLRKMLVDGQSLTEVHFNLLMKVVRATSPEVFGTHFENLDFPRVRLSAAEERIRERFWTNCTAILADRGLLQALGSDQIAPKAA